MTFRAAFAALAMFAMACAPFAGRAATPTAPSAPPSTNTIQPDPAILLGMLPNGLRYAVMQNANPAGGTSIRLGMAVGSLDEADDERGAAHFVEHLSFDGPNGASGAVMEKTFAAAGVAFGRDLNAVTDYRSTVYRIDLPSADGVALDLAFKWLRLVADGGRFTDAAVNQERGVIMAEREVRMTAGQTAADAVIRFQVPGLRMVDRQPIGTPASLAAMTSAKLNAFYERWYRPENAVVVVVGDEPVHALEAKVRAIFGSWTGRGPIPTRASLGSVDDRRAMDATASSEPTLSSALSICSIRARRADEVDDVARLRGRSTTTLWASILQARLARLAQNPAAAILDEQILANTSDPGPSTVCVVIVPTKDDWRTSLASVQAELRRFGESGVSEEELEGAFRTARSMYRGAAAAAVTRDSAALATAIVVARLAGDVTPAPSEAFRAFDAAVADLTPDDLKRAFNERWSSGGPLIALLTPRTTTAGAVMDVWKTGALGALAAAPAVTADASADWAYASFGRPGRIAKRQRFDTPNFTRINFANGVILNFMHTDFVKDQIKVAVTFGAGRREIPGADMYNATLGAALFRLGGLGRDDFARIGMLFGDQDWSADLKIGDSLFLLQGGATASGLSGELQLLTAFVSDPGFRNLDPMLATAVEAFFRGYRTNLALVVEEAFNKSVAPASPAVLPPQETFARVRTTDFQRLLKPALTQAPLEVTIVGDVEETTAIQLVSKTFGALPPRRSAPRGQTDTWFLRFGDRPPAPIRVTHDGPAEKAMVEAVWPLYVASPRRRREEVALGLLADVFATALRHRLRDELGKTYAPEAGTRMPDFADQGYLQAKVEAAPADANLIQSEIGKVAAALAAGDFTDADLETVRGPKLARLAAAARTNDWWLAGLDASARDPESLVEILTVRDLTAQVTATEVRKAAADWLNQLPVEVIATPKVAAAVAQAPP